MKIAIVHDYIKEYGGAERVLEQLLKLYPKADIYTSVYLPSFLGPHRKRFENYKIHTSILQYLPLKAKLISPFRIISPLIFKSFDLSKYDLIIVSQTGAFFPNFVQKGKAKLICYTHTPPRYLYGYMTAREWRKNPFMRFIGLVMNHFLRIADYKASENVDFFIANSKEVKARIKKFYSREATVIYPPAMPALAWRAGPQVETEIKNKEEYYLTGGRLARAKGIDVIIDAFVNNKKPLKVFGRGFAGFEERLKEKVNPSTPSALLRTGSLRARTQKAKIEFVGEVTDEEKLKLMQRAKAYIFASYDEDFGITPVEAMGVGTPVIAYRSGGVEETVIDPSTGSTSSQQASSGQLGATGVFYEPNTPESLNSAITKFEDLKIKSEDCMKQAEKFSEKEFDRKIKEVIEKNAL